MSKICVICKKPYEGEGNDARPIRTGLCCDYCFMTVRKLRLQAQTARRNKERREENKNGK